MSSPAYRSRKAPGHPERKRRPVTPDHLVLYREEWETMKSDGRCSYCQRQTTELTMDHVIPISKGGLDTPYNIVPCCGPCNRSKANKGLLQWLYVRFH